MLRVGIWPAARQLVVAMQAAGAQPARLHIRVDKTLEGRQQLAHYLAREPYLEVVVPQLRHHFDAVVHHLHRHRVHVWLVPAAVVDSVVALLAVKTTAHLPLAAALARLPTLPLLRGSLRPLPPPDTRQLSLAWPPAR